jgi:carbohydrate-binding DOMON domain-containing protein
VTYALYALLTHSCEENENKENWNVWRLKSRLHVFFFFTYDKMKWNLRLLNSPKAFAIYNNFFSMQPSKSVRDLERKKKRRKKKKKS